MSRRYDRPTRQSIQYSRATDYLGTGTGAIGTESLVTLTSSACFTRLVLGFAISGAAGCTSFARCQTPQSAGNFRQIDRAPSDQSYVGNARGASPEESTCDPMPVSLGRPIDILATASRPDEADLRTDTDDPSTLCKIDLSWPSDKASFLSDFRGDLESLGTHENALWLLGAGGISFAVHQSLDDDVAENTARHPNRWGKVQDSFGGVGNPPHQLAAISGLYAYSLIRDDVQAHELSKSLFNAVAITQISTTFLKFAANSTRPNGDPYGWPSGHTSSSFAFASVLDGYYGPWVGFPAYALAGLVAWERIDDREHDLSDVVFGVALGLVIGRTVAKEHQARFGGWLLEPYSDPETACTGIAFTRHF